jgi:pyruvate carboxylase
MRDAHQSLLATRVRTKDIVNGARIAHSVLQDLFSLECWGGATFGMFCASPSTRYNVLFKTTNMIIVALYSNF